MKNYETKIVQFKVILCNISKIKLNYTSNKPIQVTWIQNYGYDMIHLYVVYYTHNYLNTLKVITVHAFLYFFNYKVIY